LASTEDIRYVNFMERRKEMEEPLALLLVLGGLFAIAGSVLDWEWFMSSRKARVFVNLLGRGGARVFYCLLGLAVAIIGLLVTFGVIS